MCLSRQVNDCWLLFCLFFAFLLFLLFLLLALMNALPHCSYHTPGGCFRWRLALAQGMPISLTGFGGAAVKGRGKPEQPGQDSSEPSSEVIGRQANPTPKQIPPAKRADWPAKGRRLPTRIEGGRPSLVQFVLRRCGEFLSHVGRIPHTFTICPSCSSVHAVR